MTKLKTWKEKPDELEEFRRLVEKGKFECAHNPTRSSRSPGTAPRDPSQTCGKRATHVETVTRNFVMGSYRYDVPLCDEHSGYYW